MKSIYAKILGWSMATLLISMALFFLISSRIAMQLNVYPHVHTLALEEARNAWETGGQLKESETIDRLNHIMGWRHYMLDAKGRELSSGLDRSALVARLENHWDKPVFNSTGVMSGSKTSDGLYTLIVEGPIPFEPWMLLSLCGVTFLAIALLCWPLALHIGSPLRSLARTLDRFGQGDLAARAQSSRRDEIGDLGRSFDRMADRIETLMTAERRLLQDVSHELRSPLARLSFAVELVRTQPDRDSAIARARKEVARLSTLVGALLQMTRAEGDPAAGQREEFRVDELVKDLVDDCLLEAESRGCEVTVTCEKDVLMAGDHELVRRAIENVLRNAIQYSPEGEIVRVQLERVAGMARIEVRDRGPGVPEDALARIFDPFFRVDDSRTQATGGTGLGLAIAMRAIRLHSGRIEAINLNPGLLVTIAIPLAG